MLDLGLDNWRIWYEKVWAVVYLVPSDTKVLEIYLLKNTKNPMMSSYMTKLEFPPEPYMLFRLEKLPHICCLLLLWVFVKLCWPLWEVCHALKIKIMYTPQIPTAPTLGVRKTCLPSRSTKKNVLLLHWEWTQNMLDRFFIHQINAPSSCCYLKVLLQKKDRGLCKSYS